MPELDDGNWHMVVRVVTATSDTTYIDGEAK